MKTVSLNVADVLSLVTEANNGALAVSGALARILAMCDVQTEDKQTRRAVSSARVSKKGSVGHVRARAESLPDIPAARGSRVRVRPSSESEDTFSVRISEDYRTRLSASIFDAGNGRVFDYIVLISPDGTEHEIRRQQGEGNGGRARVPSAWLGEAGHVAYLNEEEPGVYSVNVSRVTAPSRERAARGSRVDPKVTRALDDAFAPAPRGSRDRREVGRIAARAEKQEKAKRTPTAAQLAARERFANETRVIRCAECDARVKIGETVDGICAKHYTVDPLPKVTQTARKRGNGKAARPTAREEASETIRALTSTKHAPAAVLPTLPTSEKIAAMRAAKARRDAMRGR